MVERRLVGQPLRGGILRERHNPPVWMNRIHAPSLLVKWQDRLIFMEKADGVYCRARAEPHPWASVGATYTCRFVFTPPLRWLHKTTTFAGGICR